MAFEDALGLTEDELRSEKKRRGYVGLIRMVFGFFTSRIGAYISLILMLVIYGLVQGLIIDFIVGQDVVILSALLASDPFSFILNVYDLGLIGIDLSTIALPIALAAVLMLVGFIISVLIIGAAMQLTLDRYEGHETNVSQSLNAAMGRLVTLFIVQLIVSTVTSYLLRPLDTISYLLSTTEDIEYLATLSGVGLLLLLPVLLAYTILMVSMVVVMDNKVGPFRSVWESIRITSRNILYSIFAVLAFVVVLFIIQLAIEVTAILLLSNYGLLVSSFIYQVLALPLIYIFQTTLYKQLCISQARNEAQSLW